jgi:predicted secreted protein
MEEEGKMKLLMNRRVFVAVVAAACLIVLLIVAPTRSGTTVMYDPWLDSNDDGKINIKDILLVAKAFGAEGQNITKASIQYDSGWVNITGMAGQYFSVTHGLNSLDLMVDISGKTTVDGGVHQKYFGGTDFVAGWNKTYGGTDQDIPYSVVQTSDGGYALAGPTYSFGVGSWDFWLVKTDSSGNMQWNKTYGGAYADYAYHMTNTSDGGYVIAGDTNSFGSGSNDIWLVKTDSTGNMQWNKTYGRTDPDNAASQTWVIQTDDGGYAIASDTRNFGSGSFDMWLVKTDASGNMQWNKTYGGTNPDLAFSVVQTDDGGYAIAGRTESFGAGYRDMWLVKTDSTGNMQWNKTYGGTGYEDAQSVVQASDGGYAIAGLTVSFGAGSGDTWLVKTDASGNMQWNKTYGGTNWDMATFISQTSDAGYIMLGCTSSFGAGDNDFWLVKTDAGGNVQWNKTYGGANYDAGSSLVQTYDGGYVLAGMTSSFGAGSYDFWLVKTDAAGNALDGFKYGLAWVGSTLSTIDLYRGTDDKCWNYVRAQIWAPR